MGRKKIDLVLRDQTSPPKFCFQCGHQLTRKRWTNGAPEAERAFGRREFCGDRCFADWERDRPEPATIAKLEAGEMRCGRCRQVKPLLEFPMAKGRTTIGTQRYGYCRPCHVDYQRTSNLKRLFNITPTEYDTITQHQNGLCAVCQRPPKPGNRLAVDHDHKTGLIRGALCWICNRTLGFAGDNPDRLRKLIEYLQNPPAVFALGERRFGRLGRTTNKAGKRKK